ncbi:MAG: PA2169 family four-helix-bundle protein [Polycyclovorans sp.]|nr:PA2169 family four-helix-bundle protein [Polycyclovorans sp.]
MKKKELNMQHNNDVLKVLNDLIRTSEDGKKGFLAAAEKAEDSGLKSLLKDRSAACAKAIDELQALVSTMGGKPEDSGSAAGAVHRGWVKARATVGDANLAVLEEVERGEDIAKAAYADALKCDLPPNVRSTVESQQQGVLKNHDRIRELRNQRRAAA